jgi:hypothetical protein
MIAVSATSRNSKKKTKLCQAGSLTRPGLSPGRVSQYRVVMHRICKTRRGSYAQNLHVSRRFRMFVKRHSEPRNPNSVKLPDSRASQSLSRNPNSVKLPDPALVCLSLSLSISLVLPFALLLRSFHLVSSIVCASSLS